MRISIFLATITSLLFLLSMINSFWLGRLLGSPRRRAFRVGYLLVTVAIVLSTAAYMSIRTDGRLDEFPLISGMLYFGPFWTVLQLLLLFAWPFSQMAVWLQNRWKSIQAKPADVLPEPSTTAATLTRRNFLFNAALLPPVAMTGINAIGVLDAEFRSVLRRMDMAYSNLPPELEGLKIAHMTDVHIGAYVSTHDVKKMVNLMQQESPDLLAITGDFVDDVSLLPDVMEMMQPFLAALPLGAWFCMGNHEHRRGAAPIRSMLQQNGIHILDNQHQRLPFGRGHFALAGVDYPVGASTAVRPEVARRFLESACDRIADTDFTILMAHHPDFLPAAFERKVDLTLAGHTHGGQVGWGRKSALDFLYPYMRGVYQEGQSIGFVSSGAGHWMPFRLNCPPEVSVITLKRKIA